MLTYGIILQYGNVQYVEQLMITSAENGCSITNNTSQRVFSLSADWADVCDGVSSAVAAGVLPHAAGVALCIHSLTWAF